MANEYQYDGEAVYHGIIERLSLKPEKSTTQIGMLTVNTGDYAWANMFRRNILSEASLGLYTFPANSVKYGQYEMALRLYYYHEINNKWPGLFTDTDEEKIRTWFKLVNKRALTVEWVDWMYAIAFGEWPEGPYLNQENGAGLLSLMMIYEYFDPASSSSNQQFLDAHSFGWNNHFRVTDDSLFYQLVWVNNALFQSLYKPQIDQENMKMLLSGYSFKLYQMAVFLVIILLKHR